MGRDKALLPWRGRPLIEHQLATLRAAGVARTCVSGDYPAYGGVADDVPGTGPLGGLASVARRIGPSAVLLVIPVDMPLLAPALLRRLGRARSDAPCLRFAACVLPMRLRLGAECRDALARLLDETDPARHSLRALQDLLGVTEIPIAADERALLADCNTEAAWRAAAGG
jgi:molybdopterin-guanine dinucleotide biosynthesis protein A